MVGVVGELCEGVCRTSMIQRVDVRYQPKVELVRRRGGEEERGGGHKRAKGDGTEGMRSRDGRTLVAKEGRCTGFKLTVTLPCSALLCPLAPSPSSLRDWPWGRDGVRRG